MTRRPLHVVLLISLALAGLTLTACNGATTQVAANAPVPTHGTAPATPVKPAKAVTGTTTTGKPASPTTTSGGSVEILNFQFLDLTAKAGEVTKVVNKDTAPHTLTADDRSFDTGIIAGDASGTFVAPKTPGTYKIHCDVHPYMTGTLTVS